MKSGIIVSIITAIIVYLYISEDTILKILSIILTVLAFIYLFSKQVIVYNFYKSKMSDFKEGISNPFINVNKVSWKILALIPNIDRITAKRIIYYRRHLGKYKNFDDFFKINQIPEEKREEIRKYIVI